MNYSRQRNVVLDIVKRSFDHPTAEEVYRKAQKVQPSIGIATVYRNLNQLADTGDIKRIPMANGHDRFDGITQEHYHMVCQCCGGLQDLKADQEDLIELRKLAIKTFGLKNKKDVEFRPAIMEGVCDKCRKMKKVV